MNLTEIVKDNILDIVIKYLKEVNVEEDFDINITMHNKDLVIKENNEVIINVVEENNNDNDEGERIYEENEN